MIESVGFRRMRRIGQISRSSWDWSRVFGGAVGIGQECLWVQAGLVENVWRSRWDSPRVSVEAGRVGQECLEEQMGLVKSVCGNRKH